MRLTRRDLFVALAVLGMMSWAAAGAAVAVNQAINLPATVPLTACQPGSNLYVRTFFFGKATLPVYHCFDDNTAKDQAR